MQFDEVGWGSGHVFLVERRQGPVWYAKYRLPDGQQIKKRGSVRRGPDAGTAAACSWSPATASRPTAGPRLASA